MVAVVLVVLFLFVLGIFISVKKPYVSSWDAAYACVNCRQWLTRDERAYSRGTCPMCGNSDDSTFVDSKKITVRHVREKYFGHTYVVFKNKEDEDWKNKKEGSMKERNFHFLWRNGEKRINEDGSIPFDVLWEYGSSIRWGVGGAHDRDYLSELISDKLSESERSVLVTASLVNLKSDTDKEYIFKRIFKTMRDKETGKLKKNTEGEYDV